ncbi:HAD family hydrolase [Labrys monachus]|uniref:HAD superfamily hydrolase (TIGR01509 family) n=1 Tax=Labrys monachus TaxID=217067 RepID=A0ABU0FFV2_9HYPH|nr:HAD family hydrolase [Labrys monachus]MDQ0392988.1 HAD superfamily hydrolase (TIGR01509 family) [Labrys monachus]
MSPSLVIFDCDGVLVDSEILSAEVEAEALQALGAEVTPQDVMRLFLGLTQADMEKRVEKDYGIKLPEDHAWVTSQMLRKAYLSRLNPIPGIREVLEGLEIPFCVASNSPPAKLGLGLSVTNLYELLYPNIFCSKLVARGKPAPDLFLYAAKTMGVASSDAVVVEDSVVGIRAAKAAGMRAIGFVGGLHHMPPSESALTAAGADDIAYTMAEVRNLIGA